MYEVAFVPPLVMESAVPRVSEPKEAFCEKRFVELAVVENRTEVVAEPRLANCEKRLVLLAVVAKRLVEVALVSVVFPLKMFVPENVLLVVVENEVEKTPVDELYARGYIALKLEEDILLLKAVQSIDARYPDCEALA